MSVLDEKTDKKEGVFGFKNAKFEIRYEEITPEYRLCKKKNGEVVLQRLKVVVRGSERKLCWFDIETVEEVSEKEEIM
ncbi:hypothetical protein [Mannheimia haemolytica]|uniref:hypothetical protein n=1 Tax=Mannheimia haemolytica TaxID=75985 RepID=UPI0001BCF7F3|nr:hypothetical protein [Mannheimia haemolytica]EEY08705.1 hypothetical protein COI_2693 [Mannheimia haemolytica serotype A2 str. OVINE]EEY13335.1 hypothetical protein COK_0568 [Mannheimia haemolytica serotype A2 str. BOVINE]MDW0723565.1 hypothetical protein [Mannheimia haemolytica]MDW0736596.1 hypothetical protein [Mannheimia haemolytica]TRC15184.1 hypothetical protein FEA50_04465 [Mannheimia haemolytica]